MTFTFWIYATIHTISYIHLILILYKYVKKKLELQNSIWFSLFKLNNDPFHFKRTYLAHFKTNLNNFCCFECVKSETTKYFWGSKTIEQWPKILNFKLQTDFITEIKQWPPSFYKNISCSFLKPIWASFVILNVLNVETTKSFWGSKTIEQWPKILSFKSQIGFLSLNYTMTPITSK